MKNKAGLAVLFLVTAVFGGKAFADGKVYLKFDKIPANIPYQRACIFFYQGQETLVLQSKYELSESDSVDSLGWVVPVPSIPEIASMTANKASNLFMSASLFSQPNIFRISLLIKGIVFFTLLSIIIISFISCIVLTVFYRLLERLGFGKKKIWMLKKIGLIALVISTLILVILMNNSRFRRSGYTFGVEEDVEVINAEQVGIYDVKVIRSDSADAILAWLEENEFGFDANDTEVFEDYINRGWCFITAKINPAPGTEEREIAVDGLAAPLILKFDTEKAIYPMALTSTIGNNTEVLIYTLSDNKLSCGESLSLEYADSRSSDYLTYIFNNEEVKQEILDFLDILDSLPSRMILCKFKGTLTPERMKQDIVFEVAPDNEPYRVTKVIW